MCCPDGFKSFCKLFRRKLPGSDTTFVFRLRRILHDDSQSAGLVKYLPSGIHRGHNQIEPVVACFPIKIIAVTQSWVESDPHNALVNNFGRFQVLNGFLGGGVLDFGSFW